MINYKKIILCLVVLTIFLSMGAVSAHMSEYPAVNIETPVHNSEVSGDVEIVATVDDHYTTEHVNFTIEGLDDSNKNYKSNYQDTNPDDGWKYTWDSTKVDDGRYYLQVRAINNLSLKGEYNILLNVLNSKDTNNTPLPDNNVNNGETTTNTTLSDKSFNFTQIYGSYIGGNGEDKAKGVFSDADGNIYLVMETNSDNLNTTEGVYQANKSGGKDIYVAKFDSTGEIIFATFIGGSSTEFEKDFKVDGEGNIYITGLTASPDFPTTDNAIIKNLTGAQSAYLTVLSADGKKLKYSTYLGGSKVDRGWALVIDDKGNAFVQGVTNSIDFPVTNGAYQSDKDGVDWDSNTSSDDIDFQNSFDLFISEIDTNSGKLIYSTYFGGRGSDSTYGSLAVKDDIIYFAGTTTSIDFPTTANANRTVRNVGEADSFLAAINITSGELLYSSYIGGNSTDDGEALFITDDGFLYYLGDTWSENFPTTKNAYQRTYGGVGDGISGGDIFAMKFDTSDWSIVYSTYLGGDADEGGRAIAVDDEGNLYIGGMSQSSNFPVTDDAFQKVKNGQVYVQDPQQHADYYTMDATLSVLSADGSELLYSTYIGGDYGEFIMGVELIDGGVILQFRTYSDDLWVSENAYQKVKGDDLYNPSLAYIGTIYEDYYANRTIYDMDTYFGIFLFNDNTTLTVSNVTVGINQQANIALNLTSGRGVPLANKEIKVTIGKDDFTVVTNDDGIAKVTTFSSPDFGTFAVTASFAGDEIYGPSQTTGIVNVTNSSLLPTFATYIGGNGEDKAKGVFTDADGNIYIVMETNSNDLNTTEGVYQANKSGGKDIYVAKFDSTGEIIFATFIGGSSTEFEKDFKVDGEGNIYITGLTASPDFPTTDNAIIKNLTGAQSAYLTVLSADGKKLKYSTYLGGSKVDRGWALVIDDKGNAFVQGVTNSIDFPVTNGAYQSDKDGVDWDSNTSSDDIDFQNSFDLFISEIDTNSGKLIYSTYFGGRGSDSTYGSLAVKDDIIYFAGTTTSIDFPTTANANRTVRNVGEADSFLAAINITSGELLYSSYIGGNSTDDGEALFITDDGFLYYLGDTWSENFPTTKNAYQRTYGGVGDGISGGDIFAMKFDTSDWSIVYSTYLGGDADEGGRAIAVDDEGNLYIGGMSQSSNFPVTDDAFQKVKNGQVYVQDPQQHADYYTMDATLSVLSADGSELLYSTYIGGDYGEFIMGVELIEDGVILQFRTYSDDLWVSENAYQKVKGDDLYNPSLAYIGTVYEDYYANRTIYDMDTYLAKYLFPNKNTTVVDAPDVEKFFKGEERFVVNVTDSKGNPLANKSVNITINGVSYIKTTDVNGTVSIALGLSSGVYNVTSVVDNITANSVVTIKSTINANDVTKVFRNGTQYYATFTDSKGNPLANGTMVRFNINGVMYDRKVNENGTAKLNINLNQGTYILTAIHPDNGEMASNNITVIPKITENSDLVKYYRNDSQYVVRIIGDDGNPIGAGETVTFNINGVMYERKTNESGYAKLNINLPPGNYVITAMCGGCNVANNITVKPILNATDISMKYRDGTQFKASLVDGQGNPYASQKVTFNINGVFYNRETDSQGIAKLNINLIAGEYIIRSMYNNSAISKKVTISA